ncbi:50S ribosomal protein L13 [bacterium]|nr:MAG: 50S ribosomal protein L13 [bacterium]
MSQKTTIIDPKTAQSRRRWVILDAKGAVLGRLASKAAVLLRGKHKAFFSPAVDCGDFVVVTNAKDVRITGEKAESKFYFRHSGYAGGAKTTTYKLQMERDPRRVIELAIKRMIPDNALRRLQLRRLKVYPGAAHPHAAQLVEAGK